MEQERQYSEQREYFGLMERVGSWNRYQLYLFLIFSIISLIQGSLIFVGPFLFRVEPYRCGLSSSQACTAFVCSLPITQRASYLIQPPFFSLADDLHYDFRCEYASTLTIFSVIIYVSFITGMLLFALFTERFGRKNSLMLSSVIFLLGLAITLLSGYLQSIALAMCGIIVTFWGIENSYQYIFCYAAEVVSEQRRVSYVNLLNVIYALGIMMNAAIFRGLKEWSSVYIYIYCIPTIIVLALVYFIIEKTPIDLLASQPPQQILKSLDRVAWINRVDHDVTIEQVAQLKQKFISSQLHHDLDNNTLLSFYRFQSLRKIAVPLICLNFYATFLFSSPSVINNSICSSIFDESIIDSLSMLSIIYPAFLLLRNVSRKMTLMPLHMFIILLSSALIYLSSDKDGFAYKAVYFTFRMAVSLSSTVIYQANFESFPTQIRAVGVRFTVLLGTMAGVVEPPLVSWLQRNEINTVYLFIVIAAIAFIPTLLMKETYNIPPPEIIEELRPSNQLQAK